MDLLRVIIALITAVGGAIFIVAAAPTATADDRCGPGYYWSTSHQTCVESPDSSTSNVTAICRDGSDSHSLTHSGTCSSHGGVAQWCPCGATSYAPSQVAPLSPMSKASVPNMPTDAVLGQSCSNWQRYIFGYDANGNVLACAGMVPDNPTWSSSVPLYGVQQIGAPCSSGEAAAQSPDGRPLLCMGPGSGWQPYYA
jgi:Protein of unknown function (DUF3761)